MSTNKFKYAWLVGGVAVLAVTLLTPPLAYGQAAASGRIVGTVKDQTDAVVPGVEVTATNTATNVPSLAISNDRGDYILDKVTAGTYDLRAELPGFKTQVSLGVILAQTQVARIDFVLTPGEIAEQVTVTGQSTVIDTDTAEVSSVIDEKKILDLPLRGRDLVKLAYLTTGGTQENQETGYTSLYSYGGGYPSFNGQYAHSNQIMLDGSNNMGYITQRPTVQATPETVQEFKVITNNYSAEYGRVGGAAPYPLRYDGVPLFDIPLHKVFEFGEEKSFDFRVDMSNAFNHAIFNAPNGNVASSSVGRVTSAATARQIQLGFRFSF